MFLEVLDYFLVVAGSLLGFHIIELYDGSIVSTHVHVVTVL